MVKDDPFVQWCMRHFRSHFGILLDQLSTDR